jgi:hypothetical protein
MSKAVPENKIADRETDLIRNDNAPRDHVVEFYSDDTAFLNTLSDYISEGLKKGESVIVVATASHRVSLEFRLRALGFPLSTLVNDDRYIALDAEETLGKLMIGDLPDERVFQQLATLLLGRARKNGCGVRAFGEMVALLWTKGNKTASKQLESLWNQLRRKQEFQLFCAYPSKVFDKNSELEIQDICSAHTSVVKSHPLTSSHPQS